MFSVIKDRRSEGDTVLRQCQLVQLYLLDVFAAICEKHKLRYWLDYGTLLGAKRHGGFIPWDDDLDVSMPVDDYAVLKKIIRQELPADILFQDLGQSSASPFSFGKLRDRRSFFCEDHVIIAEPCGIFLDIFAWAPSPKLPKWLLNAWCHFQYSALRHSGTALRRFRTSIFKKMLDCLISLGWKVLYNIAWHTYTLSRYMFPSKRWRSQQDLGEKIEVDASDLFPLSQANFEGGSYSVPHDPDKILTVEYGDWRQLPPVEKRRYHAKIIMPMQAPDANWALKKDMQG